MRNLIFLIFLCVWLASCASTSDETRLYNEALQSGRSMELKATFFTLRQLLRDYPDSVYASDAEFALGEYYFNEKDYHDSYNMLLDFLDSYPEHKGRPFALAMIYKILMYNAKDKISAPVSEKIKDNFFSKPLFLLFSQSRDKIYHSLLNTKFTIREYIDKIEIIKNDETFLVVYP